MLVNYPLNWLHENTPLGEPLEAYVELWEVSLTGRPELSDPQRKALLDQLLGPALDPKVDGAVKSAVLVRFFQIALAALMWPLLQT